MLLASFIKCCSRSRRGLTRVSQTLIDNVDFFSTLAMDARQLCAFLSQLRFRGLRGFNRLCRLGLGHCSLGGNRVEVGIGASRTKSRKSDLVRVVQRGDPVEFALLACDGREFVQRR